MIPNSESNSTKPDFGQWHLIAYFFKEMISAKTCYETHNNKFSAIFEAFKTWRHYLEGCKYKVFVLIDHNNLCWFMETKSWNFKTSLLGSKNSLITTFELIIVNARHMKLLMSCLNILSKVRKRKRLSEWTTSRSYTACSSYWPMPVFQASASKPS